MTSPLKRLWSIGHHESRLTKWVRARRRAQERRPQTHRRFSDDQHSCRACHANYFRETTQRRADWMTCAGCGGWYHVRCAGVACARERAVCSQCSGTGQDVSTQVQVATQCTSQIVSQIGQIAAPPPPERTSKLCASRAS